MQEAVQSAGAIPRRPENVTRRAGLGRELMRLLVRGAVALLILLAAYWGWALVGAAQLASAASRGDAQAVMERVDLQPLIRSLSSQIARAYLDENPELQKLLPPAGPWRRRSSTPPRPRCCCALFSRPRTSPRS